MSRIGNKVITLPAGVEVTNNDNVVTVKGPKGELTREFNKNIEIKVEGNEVTLHRPNDSKENKTIHQKGFRVSDFCAISLCKLLSHFYFATVPLFYFRKSYFRV